MSAGRFRYVRTPLGDSRVVLNVPQNDNSPQVEPSLPCAAYGHLRHVRDLGGVSAVVAPPEDCRWEAIAVDDNASLRPLRQRPDSHFTKWFKISELFA